MSSGKVKDNVKQRVAQNLYQTLITESEKTYQNDQPNFISKNCKKLNEICTQNKFSYPKYTVLRVKTSSEDSDPNSKTNSFLLAQINIHEHFVIQAGPTSELAENRAALKLLLLLMRSHDLCDEKFYNNDDKKMQKTKNQSIQTDPRPKLIPWENSC